MKQFKLFISFIFFSIFCTHVLQAQYVAYPGNPPTFNTFDESYVRPTYGSSYQDYTSNIGVLYGQSHRFVTQQGTDPNACYPLGNNNYGYLQVLPCTWDGDITQQLDTVIQIGTPSAQGRKCQQIEYFFYPDINNSVLLINFAFVLENKTTGSHNNQTNPQFWIELLDETGNNLLNMGNDGNPNHPYSRFGVVALGESTTLNPNATPIVIDYQHCPQNVAPNASSDVSNVEWMNWTVVAFNLTEFAEDNEAVKLRIKCRACQYTAHWAYAYFAAKFVPATIDVKACGNDDITLDVPWGFDANSYQWYFGTDANNYYSIDDGITPHLTSERNTNFTYYRCEMVSKTGAPFVYEAYVNYYELNPGFEYEQLQRDCKYEVQFTNTSSVTIINNGQNIEEEVEFVEWDFGDGSPRSHEVNPLHEYAAPGDYQVRLILFDSENTCSDTLEAVTITIDPSATQISESSDTIRDCEKNFPVRYDEATFGDMYEFGQAGTYQVTYPDASANGCDSIVHVTVIVDKPTVVIEQQYDYCDAFYAILHANTNAINPTYLWSTDETTNSIEINTPATYSLTVTDENGCVCQDDILINACTPNIVLPNSITPSDENNLNDYFEIPQRNLIQTIEFSVFDRNGSLVYHTTDKDFKWYGDVNGKTFYHATYNYVLIIVDYNGIESMRKGSITVF